MLDFTTRTYFSDAVLCLDDGNGVAGDGERFFVNKAVGLASDGYNMAYWLSFKR